MIEFHRPSPTSSLPISSAAPYRCSPDCLFQDCGYSAGDCAIGSDSSAVVVGDDATTATTSDRALPTTTDGTSTAATDDTSSSATQCLDEYQTCIDDPACFLCTEALNDVLETCEGPDYDEETSTCSEKLDILCCYLDGMGADCGSDELLGAYQGRCSTR